VEAKIAKGMYVGPDMRERLEKSTRELEHARQSLHRGETSVYTAAERARVEKSLAGRRPVPVI
jgi:hypothetical protein